MDTRRFNTSRAGAVGRTALWLCLLAQGTTCFALTPKQSHARFGVFAELAGHCWAGGDESADKLCFDLDPAGARIDVRTFRVGQLESISTVVPDKSGESAWSATATINSADMEEQQLSLDLRSQEVIWTSPMSQYMRLSQDCRTSWRVVLRKPADDRFTLTQYYRGPCKWQPQVTVRSFVRVSIGAQLDLAPRRDQ